MLKKIKKIATKTEIGEKAVTDKQFRAGVFACGSLLINLAYAVYNGFTGIKQSSSWYIAIFAYYAVLAVMRFYVVSYEFKKTTKRTDRNIMRFCGRMLIVLAAVLVVTVALGVLLHQDTSKPVTMMIVTAVYTFWKAIYAVVKIIRAAKDGAPVLLALRNISCADAAASMLHFFRGAERDDKRHGYTDRRRGGLYSADTRHKPSYLQDRGRVNTP